MKANDFKFPTGFKIQRVVDPKTGKATITILSVNGGGERGIIPGTVLDRMEKKTGRRIAKLFKILAGTSTGGILINGLTLADCCGQPKYTAEQMVQLYIKEGPKIFNKSLIRQVWNQVIVGGAKYPASGIESVLNQYFGDALYKDQLCLTIVAAYEASLRSAWFFKNYDPDDGARKTSYVCRATSAAPTYFPPLLNGATGCFIDGGVAANDPALCALAEAILLSEPGDDFLVVSIGTGKYLRPYTYKQLAGFRLWDWAVPTLDILMDSQPQVTTYVMEKLLKIQLPQQYHDRIEQALTRFYSFDTNLDDTTDAMDNTDPAILKKLQDLGNRVVDVEQTADFNAVCDRLVQICETEEAVVAAEDARREQQRVARNESRRKS